MSACFFPDRQAIETRQLQTLKQLLATCLESSAFYADKIKSAGIDASLTNLNDFYQSMPLTTKAELVADQNGHPPYGSNLTEPVDHYTRFSQTSSTTNTPLRWLDTPQSWQGMIDNWKQVFQAAGVNKNDRCLFAFSFAPFIGFWLAFEAASQLGCLSLPAGGLSSSARLKMIMDNRVTVLCCTPTYAIRLAQVTQSEKVDLAGSSVKTIIVAGEPGGSIPATRNHIESLWPGAKVFDHHGMTEVGPVSFACCENPTNLHVMENAFIPEILDPVTHKTTEPGQTGELILTTLIRTASPLLRYRTGDLVKAVTNNPCGCGRFDLTLEGGILSRADDMVIIRGVNLFPSAVEAVLRTMPDLVEYQVVVDRNKALADIKIKVELASAIDNEKRWLKSVENKLRDAFALRIPVTIVDPGALPHFEMKAKRWIYLPD